MHFTSLYSGKFFAEVYGKENMTVLDIGGTNVNGSLRGFFTSNKMKYICLDIEPHPSVDIVVKPGDKLPFENGSIDIIVSTSCFEHDPCFWITFKEMCRVIKSDGIIYVNAPSNGEYHKYPGDNWRFYPDAGQALAYWSGISYNNETIYPVSVKETFFIKKEGQTWIDFICIWQRSNYKEETIVLSDEIKYKNGLLKQKLIDNGFDVTTSI